MWNLGGHLGSSVSALVDGQMDAASAERAWSHVMTCPRCRRLVEREGWVKTQLASMGGSEPSARLIGSLFELDERPVPAAAFEAWIAVDTIERKGRGRRRAGLALVGAGSVSAAVFGFASLGAVGLGIGTPAGTPATSLTRPTASPTASSTPSRQAVPVRRLPMPAGLAEQRSVLHVTNR
jgi:hypothetical protein